MPYNAKIKYGEWTKEWKNMPEFEQDDLSPQRTIYIHFRNEEDVQEFAKLIGQKITEKKKYYWYPEKKPNKYSNRVYVDES